MKRRLGTAVAPMRCHPFHYGHALYFFKLLNFFNRIVIVLNRDVDNETCPFPFEMRRGWIDQYICRNRMVGICVPDRIPNMGTVAEYYTHSLEDDFVVMTTNETNERYIDLGFKTWNHEKKPLVSPPGLDAKYIRLEGVRSIGTKVRSLLRSNLPCDEYLDQDVWWEAREHILKRHG